MRICKLQPLWYLRSGGVENWAFFFAWNLCIKSNHRCRNRSWYDEKLSKFKTAKRFATHFSISLHSASTGITVLRIDLQDAWTRASHYGLFRETFLRFFSRSLFCFFLRFLYLFSVIFTQRKFPQRIGHAEHFRHCWKALQLLTFLKSSALPWRNLIGCNGVIILYSFRLLSFCALLILYCVSRRLA